MVYYRKYRPQKISELDSTVVREKLVSVFSSNASIPHAFLFTGPKGLGKTSTARIVAKAVNCELRLETGELRSESGKVNIEPCNQCEQCISITNGTNLDVLEIDAASNRGIDEMRELKDKIRLSPVSAKKKVYIIDEVHMLTTEAFNALLKTLEEPPDHAMFVLCTTEPHKVLGTIISRCFHIHFSLATEDEIVHSLKRIVSGEKLDSDDEALHVVARMAEGGFRDAAKLLEEVVLLADNQKITAKLVEDKYTVSSITYHVSELLLVLAKKDTKKSLSLIQEIAAQGMDLKYVISQVLATLHKQLLIKIGVEEGTAPVFELAEIKKLVSLFTVAYQEMKNAVLPQLPLELAVIEYCQAQNYSEQNAELLRDAQEVIARNGVTKQSRSDNNLTNEDMVTVSSLRKQVGVIQKNKALYGEPKITKEDKQVIATVSVDLMKVPADGEVTKEWQDAFWTSLISEMKHHNHTVAGVLRSCGVRSFDKKELIIETAYKFHKERLDEMKNQEALAKVCKVLTGNDIKIAVELKNTN